MFIFVSVWITISHPNILYLTISNSQEREYISIYCLPDGPLKQSHRALYICLSLLHSQEVEAPEIVTWTCKLC